MEQRIVVPTAAYDYRRMQRDAGLLAAKHRWLQTEAAGFSVMGKELTCIRLGGGPRRLQVNAAFHANEWITSLVLMGLLEEMAAACEANGTFCGCGMRQLLAANTIWLVPMVNPDGVDLVLHGASHDLPFRDLLLEWNGGSNDFSGWKANIRGVDLNDQFPACWELERDRRMVPGPGPRDYGGEAPLTEPEAIAMAQLALSKDFHTIAALHTQGEEIYWNYRGCEPPEAEALAERLACAGGYRAVKLTDSDAGYKDWFIRQFRRPGFTIELGLGVNPLPLEQLPKLQDAARAMLAELML